MISRFQGIDSRTLVPLLIAGTVLLNLLVAGLAAWSLSQSRHLYEDRATAETQNLARLLEQDIVTLMAVTDRVLQDTAREMGQRLAADRLGAEAVNAYLQRARLLLPDLAGLRVTDQHGTVTYGPGVASGKGPSIADRPYFQSLRGNPELGMVVSSVAQTRVTGQRALILARAIQNQNGQFAGAVVATLPLSRITRPFADLKVGPNASFTLFDDELQIVVRFQEGRVAEELAGQRFGSPPLQKLMRERASAGTYLTMGSVDNVERIFTYMRLPHGLNISVGQATSDYLGQWREEAFKTAAMVAIFALITLLLTWFVQRGWKLQERTLQALQHANRTLEAEKQLNQTIVRSSPFAIYTRDRRGLVTGWNPAAEKLFGWTADAIIGHQLPTVPPGREQETADLRERVLAGETIMDLEVLRQKRDGTVFDLSTTLAPLHDANGLVTGYLAIATDITERKAAAQRIEFLAYRDVLTGLPNRLLLQDRFQQTIAHAERAGTKVALMFIDLDNFKTINDSLGHAVGDGLLKEVSERLRQCVRDTDTISRQGGDEFLIVLPDLRNTEAITPVLSKIRNYLHAPLVIDDHELTTSASIGIALYPDDGLSFDVLLQKADTAMYQAKGAGRSNYRYFDEKMNAEAIEHLQLRNGLRRALERQELLLHYQPQIDLRTGRVIGVEALLRWQHPQQGMISPTRFIPVAEDSGLIVPIGEWVLHEACRQAMAWRDAGLPELTVAVNLSAVQFRRGDVEHAVAQALHDSGFDPHLLELELTESILITNPEQVFNIVKRLKQRGLRLSLDDFGTGYSSLSYLKRFDIDKLKIDQSFVRDLATDPDDAAIIRAIIQMAHSLGVQTIAEGVEDGAILAELGRFECDEAQGYFFSRPLPADELTEWLRTRLASMRPSDRRGVT